MIAYVDTNIILAKYIPNDPNGASCKRFFKENELEKLVSSLSLLELSCVFSRLLNAGEVEFFSKIETMLGELSHEEKVQTMVEYVLKDCDLRVADAEPIPLTLNLLGSPTKMTHIYLKALGLASRLMLKTLDTLHLAHISCLKDEGTQIEYLVTNDVDMLTRRDQILEVLQSRVLSSNEVPRL